MAETNLRWYLLITAGNQEKAVAKKLQAKGIEVYLPVHTLERQWSDRKKKVVFPLFPGRLFARFGPAPEDGKYVFNTPGLTSAFGGRDRVPIADEEIEMLQRTLDLGLPCTAAPLPTSGMPVSITEQPEIEGLLVHGGDPCRIAVPFPWLGEAVVVEIPAERVRTGK